MGRFEEAINVVAAELGRAREKFPNWSQDPVHAASVVAEECGELQRAVLQACYEGAEREKVRKEAIQTAAMAMRFLMNLDRYVYAEAPQFVEGE